MGAQAAVSSFEHAVALDPLRSFPLLPFRPFLFLPYRPPPPRLFPAWRALARPSPAMGCRANHSAAFNRVLVLPLLIDAPSRPASRQQARTKLQPAAWLGALCLSFAAGASLLVCLGRPVTFRFFTPFVDRPGCGLGDRQPRPQ